MWTYPVQEGPRVTAMRCSLDRQQLGCLRYWAALHPSLPFPNPDASFRGGTLLELIDLASGNTSVFKSSEALLGFFFTEAPGADVVLVSRSGLELCEYVAKHRGLRSRFGVWGSHLLQKSFRLSPSEHPLILHPQFMRPGRS